MRRIATPAEYFAGDARSTLLLTPDAAIAVCELAADQGYWVARVEGGIVRGDRFEARLDCIWDGKDDLRGTADAARRNNRLAAADIATERRTHDAFVVTLLPAVDRP